DVTGKVALGNKGSGVLVDPGAGPVTIGGVAATTGAAPGNVISGNQYGVQINGSNNNLVIGNLIGTDITGKTALGNTVDGVLIIGGATGNTVGGGAAGDRNVISGNNANGVDIQ